MREEVQRREVETAFSCSFAEQGPLKQGCGS